jgi:branched-chain amino acid transport system substrate-binding protein
MASSPLPDRGAGAESVFATTPGLALKDLGDAGKVLCRLCCRMRETKEPYAIMGYDTMGAVLKGIEDVCAAGGVPTDRAAVTKAVMSIKDFDGALGKWSFDANGDITSRTSSWVR